MTNNPFILMWLEAPLQSWGNDSIFDRRDTLHFPTKSGVMGLICCALGAGGEQKELLAEFAPLKQSVLAFKKHKEKPDILCDYQVTGSGFDDKNDWGNNMIPKKPDGKKRTGSATKITYRYYLQDVAFAVVLETPATMAKQIANALENPVWDLYLGRKNCIPTDLVYKGMFDEKDKAINSSLTLGKEKKLSLNFKVFDKDYVPTTDEYVLRKLMLNDIPVKFGTSKEYKERYVQVIYDKTDANSSGI